MSAPGLALLLTELHSSFPRSLCFGNLLVCELLEILNGLFYEQRKFRHLCSTMKKMVSQLASCQLAKWTLKLFSEDSTNLSGSGTDASRQGSEGLQNEVFLWKWKWNGNNLMESSQAYSSFDQLHMD